MGFGVSGEGQLAIPLGGHWYPWGGHVGVGLEGDVRPHAMKQTSIAASLSGRW